MFVSASWGWWTIKQKAKERLLPKKKRKRGQECCGYCEKRITIGLCVTGLRCTRFSRNERVSGKPDAKSLERNSKSSIHKVYATSRKCPGQERTNALINTSQTSTSAKSLRYKIRGSVPRKDWKTRAMCPKQGLRSCQKYIQAQSERQSYVLLACKVGLPSASAREPEEREFVVDSRASMHMVSENDFNSSELETMRTSRNPTTVMAANGEVRTNKEATIHVKQLDLLVNVMLLQETPAVLSLEKLCDEHGYTYHWKSG